MKSVVIIDIIDAKLLLKSVVGNQLFLLSEVEEYQEKFYAHKTLRHPEFEESAACFIELYVGYLVTYVLGKVFRQEVVILKRDDDCTELLEMVSLKELKRDFELMQRHR